MGGVEQQSFYRSLLTTSIPTCATGSPFDSFFEKSSDTSNLFVSLSSWRVPERRDGRRD